MTEKQDGGQQSGYNSTDAATDASSGCLFFGGDFDLGCITETLGCLVLLACLGAMSSVLFSSALWFVS